MPRPRTNPQRIINIILKEYPVLRKCYTVVFFSNQDQPISAYVLPLTLASSIKKKYGNLAVVTNTKAKYIVKFNNQSKSVKEVAKILYNVDI